MWSTIRRSSVRCLGHARGVDGPQPETLFEAVVERFSDDPRLTGGSAVEKHINAIFSKLLLAEESDVNRRVRAVLIFLSRS